MTLLTTTDPLTQLGNRRRVDQLIDDLRARGGNDLPLAVMIVDIDHFKAINDRYGHNVGDTVLSIVAARLRGGMRNGDEVCRWGGEEFIILAAEATSEEAGQLAERLRVAVGANPIALDDGVDRPGDGQHRRSHRHRRHVDRRRRACGPGALRGKALRARPHRHAGSTRPLTPSSSSGAGLPVAHRSLGNRATRQRTAHSLQRLGGRMGLTTLA